MRSAMTMEDKMSIFKIEIAIITIKCVGNMLYTVLQEKILDNEEKFKWLDVSVDFVRNEYYSLKVVKCGRRMSALRAPFTEDRRTPLLLPCCPRRWRPGFQLAVADHGIENMECMSFQPHVAAYCGPSSGIEPKNDEVDDKAWLA
ncbi:hypothetical protein Leryth_026820 [Lithospermum erythrorhizon]|nr:hypothetical protein Leryth_026820 [Lithospermum erythrorhizon]